jgi:hypothetical protein
MTKLLDFPTEQDKPAYIPDTDLERPPRDAVGKIVYVNSRGKEITRKVKIVQVRPYGWSLFFTDNGSAKSPKAVAIYFHAKDSKPVQWGILHGENHSTPWVIKAVFWQAAYKRRFEARNLQQQEIF